MNRERAPWLGSEECNRTDVHDRVISQGSILRLPPSPALDHHPPRCCFKVQRCVEVNSHVEASTIAGTVASREAFAHSIRRSGSSRPYSHLRELNLR